MSKILENLAFGKAISRGGKVVLNLIVIVYNKFYAYIKIK